METLDFSCSSRKREEVDGKALAGDKTVLSSLSLPSSRFPFFFVSPHLSHVASSFFVLRTSMSPLLPRSVARIFVGAFKYCAKKFDPLSKVQRVTATAGRNVDGVSKRV